MDSKLSVLSIMLTNGKLHRNDNNVRHILTVIEYKTINTNKTFEFPPLYPHIS